MTIAVAQLDIVALVRGHLAVNITIKALSTQTLKTALFCYASEGKNGLY